MKRKSFLLTMVFMLMVSLLTGCGNTDDTTPSSADNNLKIGGSSTLAPIIAKCADNFTEEYKTWNNVDASLPEEPIVIFVSTGGSGFGVKSAINGTFDIGLAAREIKNEELEQLPNGQIIKIGSDVLTIAVNSENPVSTVKPNLTIEELKQIFAGEITVWKQLDDQLPDSSINVLVRDLGGGASEVFDTAVMKGTPISKEAQQIPSMGALAGKVMENNYSIGYVSSGLVNQNPDQLIALSVDGIAPTLDNINSGAYKIGRPLLLITKEEPNSLQAAFLDYLLSEEGLKVVEDMGYIPAQ